MNKLLLIIFNALVLNAYTQDGLIKYIDTDSTDTFISIYNSPADTRIETANLLYVIAIQQLESKTGNYMFNVNEALIRGELFITKNSNYILYDFYVDEVCYFNGENYTATRHQKPEKPKNYYKF